MAVIETRYSVGDVVWHAGTTTETKQHPCPDCNDTRRWDAKSPAGNEYTFACPRCSARYSSFDKLSITYTAHVPTARKLTIGSVRHETAGAFGKGPQTTYMCLETGVGGGSVYDEQSLFNIEADALACATLIASEANSKIPHIVARYDSSLQISDYQLDSALLKAAKDEESKAYSLIWNINDLFSSIDEADDKDAVLELVDDYKRFNWERDKEASAANAARSEAARGKGE